MDYEQFWLNLTDANTSNGKWQSEYKFSQLYEMDSTFIEPKTFEQIYDKFKSNVSWFDKYFEANSVKKVDYKCDKNCKSFHLCAISEQDYVKFENCIENSIENTASVLSFSSLIILLLFLILFIE